MRAEARRAQRSGARRRDQPVSSIYLGLHIGDVFYGNIGSKDRLDFTVVGQAVNEASRIASMCRSADRDVLFSSDFRDALPEPERARLVSVGRYALRGVSRAQELFTLDPEVGRQEDRLRLALPLIALPGTSPRENGEKKAGRNAEPPSPAFGERVSVRQITYPAQKSASACRALRCRARPRRRSSGTSAASCRGRRRAACRWR